MTSVTEIRLETLSAAVFRPFGQIIGRSAGAPSYSASLLQGWRIDYEAEGPTDLFFIEYKHGPFECDAVERHFNVTQSFVALGNAASIMLVAAPTGRQEYPQPEALRAFHVPGSVGIMLRKGTWHAPTRFPVRPPGAAFVMLTGRETQQELERVQAGGAPPSLTETLDLVQRHGTIAKIVDPDFVISH
jgi:ureidoglycolate lyase